MVEQKKKFHTHRAHKLALHFNFQQVIQLTFDESLIGEQSACPLDKLLELCICRESVSERKK